jgi:hypothetical protein
LTAGAPTAGPTAGVSPDGAAAAVPLSSSVLPQAIASTITRASANTMIPLFLIISSPPYHLVTSI